jgi:hypothetical protein
MPPPTNHEQQQCQIMTLNNFKVQSEAILNELTAYHSSKRRLIEHTFQKLFDNLPATIKDFPVYPSIDDYLTMVKEEKEAKAKAKDKNNMEEEEDDDDDDDHVALFGNEDMDHQNDNNGHSAITNLTSTVKKVNTKELELLDNIINEHSVIHGMEIINQNGHESENNDNTLNAEDDNDNAKERLKSEDYRCKIIYFFKNFTQAIANLEDLESIDPKLVHESSLKDLERIRQTFVGANKK